jgi:hypothetical protein
LGYQRPGNNDMYPVAELIPQVVVGHRIWRESAAVHRERFIDLKGIQFVDNRSERRLWLRLFLSRGDLSRYSITRRQLLTEGRLAGMFREVDTVAVAPGGERICLEQQVPLSYTGRPTDVVADLVAAVRPQLWRIVSAVPSGAYRRYYIHMSPAGRPLSQSSSLARRTRCSICSRRNSASVRSLVPRSRDARPLRAPGRRVAGSPGDRRSATTPRPVEE